MNTMKASYVVGKRQLEMREVAIPTPKDNEVLIRVRHAGVCGSDLHFYEELKCSVWTIEEPIVLGHECGGEIVSCGKDVAGFKQGDIVAVEPGYTCGKCEFCLTGRYNLCPEVRFMTVPETGNVPATDGAYAEYICWPAERVFKMPKGFDTIDAFLMEPLAVGFYAAVKAKAEFGQTVVVLGAGTIGLTTLLALKERGVKDIFVVDMVAKRLQLAKKLGASRVVQARDENIVDVVMEATDGKGADVVLETAGTKITTMQTLDLVKSGGRIVFVGMTPNSENIPLDTAKILAKEAELTGIVRYRHCYPLAIKALENGCPIREIITHEYPFDKLQDALEIALSDKENTIKVMVEL